MVREQLILSFVTNSTQGRARREIHKGRSYLVAPLTMIVPGVLPGSKGALMYPHQEVAKNPGSWDGMPITRLHPSDPITNEHLSAKSRGVWARQGLGRVRNTQYGGKLRAEGWFDEERTRELAPEVLSALLSGQPMEISTGLYTDNHPSRGTYNGRAYDYVARNYRPDHLAVLPGQVGACSVQDGCGLNVNQLTMKPLPSPAILWEVLEAVVENANPNHDDLGRFSAGGTEGHEARQRTAMAAKKVADAAMAHVESGGHFETAGDLSLAIREMMDLHQKANKAAMPKKTSSPKRKEMTVEEQEQAARESIEV